MAERLTVQLDSDTQALRLYGPGDQWLQLLREGLPITIVARGLSVVLEGEEKDVQKGVQVLEYLSQLALVRDIVATDIIYAIEMAGAKEAEETLSGFKEVLLKNVRGESIRIRTLGQKHYIKAIEEKTITFGVGPAGTGKTFLAVVMAVRALKQKKVERIILTRPAVEAGEKLGFLPGDLQEKVDPYLRPLYDGLFQTLGSEVAERYIERGIIEIAPLAYMRGRTLENAFIILDEAQNTTPEQMKMFLTRIGFGSRAVITGDVTQIDLPKKSASGLLEAERILKGIEEISFQHLKAEDVVRHPVVAKIIRAYDAFDDKKERDYGAIPRDTQQTTE